MDYETYNEYPIIKRGIYYCARMISSQYGTVFAGAHYEKIQKVYSVWICMNPPARRKNTITEYSLNEKNIVGAVEEKEEFWYSDDKEDGRRGRIYVQFK